MEEQNQNQDLENQEQEVKTFSEDEVQKMLQSETDKRVSQALKTAQDKWQSEFEAKLEAEKNEAEKLAKMSEAERQQAQIAKEKAEWEEEKKVWMKEKLELQTVKELSQLGLPTDFSAFVMANDAETIKSNIDSFKSQWEQALEKAVNERLQGTTPKTATKTGASMTKEQFKKLSYQERVTLYSQDPELYNQLNG